MKWTKKNKICDMNTLGLDWYKKNSMVPVPYLINDETIRIFLTMCDDKNVGRIGYVDVNANDPSEIKGYSKEPLIDIGFDGTFDDSGVVTSSLFDYEGKLYMFYSGYELAVKVPYKIFCGFAVSEDNGETFKKLTNASMLPAINEELFNRCAPFVMKIEDDRYRLFYLGDSRDRWKVDGRGKKVPVYTMKYLESDNPFKWPVQEGKIVMDFKNDDESGLTLPDIYQEDGIYKMVYSIRTLSKGYVLGYAESKDAKVFDRMDDKISFEGEDLDWDSEMMCFAKTINVKDKSYMFYSGNHYGMGGIGYAELKKG
jgi:hypothetical protein